MADADVGTGAREQWGVLPAGTRLQKYELTSVLGQGSFGITYLGRDTQLDREVAIKEYLPTSLALRGDGTMVRPRSTELAEDFVWGRDRFLDEARTLAKLGDTPSIIRVFDFLEANGTAYMIMALVRGETLEQQLERAGPLPPAGVERLLPPLLEALKEVHATGYLHRDIKPANIMFDAKGSPILIDFGASRAAMAGRSTALTAVFTPGYAAPEQFSSAKQGPWTDIYGLSATLHHAIVGKPPPSAFDRTLDDEYVPLMSAPPAGFAPGLLAGIDAGLAVRATGRPQSIADWRRILDQRGGGATITLPRGQAGPNATPQVKPAALPPPPPPPLQQSANAEETSVPHKPLFPSREVALWVGGAVMILALVAGGVFFSKDGRPVSQREPSGREMQDKVLRTMLADGAKSTWLLSIVSSSFGPSGSLLPGTLKYLIVSAQNWTTVALYYESNRATDELAARLKQSLATSGVPESKIALVTHGQCPSGTCPIEVRGLNLK